MSQEQAREERAFEALIVEASRRIDREDVCVDDIREPTETDLAALELLENDFVDRLVSGKLDETEDTNDEAGGEFAVAGDAACALFRSDGVDNAVEEQLNKADEEIVQRKKRERHGEAS